MHEQDDRGSLNDVVHMTGWGNSQGNYGWDSGAELPGGGQGPGGDIRPPEAETKRRHHDLGGRAHMLQQNAALGSVNLLSETWGSPHGDDMHVVYTAKHAVLSANGAWGLLHLLWRSPVDTLPGRVSREWGHSRFLDCT